MKTLADAISRKITSSVRQTEIDAATTAALDWMKSVIPAEAKDDEEFDFGWNAVRKEILKRIKEERG